MNAKNLQIFSALLLSMSLSGHVAAHEAHHEHVRMDAKSAAEASTAPIAARYDLKVVNGRARTQTDWYLWRDAARVETANAVVAQGDIWERLGANEYQHRRVFHKDKRVVEYTPGEIRIRHAEPDWSKLASVISPQLLDSLKRGASRTLFGQKAVRYSGKVGDQYIDLWWLEQARLPASMQTTHDGQRMTLSLRELHDKGPASWPRVKENEIADYGNIDIADFGDMESDPFVARVMLQDGHGHSH